jgi:hypothetical protein
MGNYLRETVTLLTMIYPFKYDFSASSGFSVNDKGSTVYFHTILLTQISCKSHVKRDLKPVLNPSYFLIKGMSLT